MDLTVYSPIEVFAIGLFDGDAAKPLFAEVVDRSTSQVLIAINASVGSLRENAANPFVFVTLATRLQLPRGLIVARFRGGYDSL